MKYSSMRSPTTNILEFQLKFTPAAPAATTTTTAPAAPTATTGADNTVPAQTPKDPTISELMEKEKGINQIGNKTNSSDLNYYNSDKKN